MVAVPVLRPVQPASWECFFSDLSVQSLPWGDSHRMGSLEQCFQAGDHSGYSLEGRTVSSLPLSYPYSGFCSYFKPFQKAPSTTQPKLFLCKDGGPPACPATYVSVNSLTFLGAPDSISWRESKQVGQVQVFHRAAPPATQPIPTTRGFHI